MPRPKIKTKATRSKLIEKADKAYSIYVREKYANSDGIVLCFTCEKPFPIKKIHCGHYISRFYKYTRWDLNNLRPQCMMCNLWKRGDSFTFRAKLVEEIGELPVVEMERKAKNIFNEKDTWIEQKLREILPQTENTPKEVEDC